jgi:putative aldouronate transport system substrate-binding protein
MYSGKKILAFALATATAVPMMFTGCSTTTSSTASGSSTEAPKETVTLTVFSGDKAIQGIDRVTTAVNDYLKKQNTGLAIKWEALSWDDLGKKETTMLSTGQEADVMNSSSWLSSSYVGNSTKGYFKDLTPYLTDAKNKDLVDLIGQDFLDGTKVAGKYYGLPTNKEKAHNFGFLAQTDELKKLNIDPTSIKTMDDMAKYFDQVKKDGLIPVCAAKMDNPYKLLDWDAFESDTSPFAFDPTDEKTVVDPFTADKTVAFYKEMKDWHDKGYFSPNASTASNQETEMKTGKYFCGSWSLMPGKADTEATSLGLNLTQIDITPYEKTNRETLGALTVIPAASKHPDQAFQFIKLLYTDKTLINLMTYGVEGTDYTKKSDNVIEVAKTTDFSSAGGWIWGNTFNNFLTTNQKSTYYTDIDAYNKAAKPLDNLGFIFDNTPVKTEYANCGAVVTKYYPQLFYGTAKDVDATVKEFKDKLDAAGEVKLLAEVQKQYDAWKASK